MTKYCMCCGNNERHCRCINPDYKKMKKQLVEVEMQESVRESLRCMTLSDLFQVQMENHSSITSRVSYDVLPNVQSHLLSLMKGAGKEIPVNANLKVENFVTRPFSLSATALSDSSNFNKCFNIAPQIGSVHLPSKCIDLYLGEMFNSLLIGVHDLQQVNYLDIRIKGKSGDIQEHSAKIFAKPDAIWFYDDVKYIIEFKTIFLKRFEQGDEKLPHARVLKWLMQIAAYQLSKEENIKYLLVVIVRWEGVSTTEASAAEVFECCIVEVLPENLFQSKLLWGDWIRNAPKGKMDLMMQYQNEEITMDDIIASEITGTAASRSSTETKNTTKPSNRYSMK
jgi:hypothetical protein